MNLNAKKSGKRDFSGKLYLRSVRLLKQMFHPHKTEKQNLPN